MTDQTTITDPIEAARQATVAGIEWLQRSREEYAELAARQDTERAAVGEKLAAANERFAAAEAEQTRLERIAEAHVHYDNVRAAYAPLAGKADSLVSDLDIATDTVIRLHGDAIIAERARDKASKQLAAAHRALTDLDPDAPLVRITSLRLHNQRLDTPRGLIGLAVTLADNRFANERDAALALINKQPPKPHVIISGTG